MNTIEGNLVAPAGARFTLVAGRFNDIVVGRLIAGARDTLVRHGAAEEAITLVRAPGAWEIPYACKLAIESQRPSAVIALGAVIRGSTPHFDYVCAEVSKGVATLGLSSGTIVTFGVLTADTMDQAFDRAGGKAGNKGAEAALAALEMVSLRGALGV